jgi:LPXTG-site transpeptidase (sortase) family protein
MAPLAQVKRSAAVLVALAAAGVLAGSTPAAGSPAGAPSAGTRGRTVPRVQVDPGRGPAGFVPADPVNAGPVNAGPVNAGPARPARVRIPVIQVDAALEDLHLDASGALDAPTKWNEAGWYADGVVPGEVGPAVIAGHVDSTRGPAVFARLDKLRPGDVVEVLRGGQWLGFVVTAVRRYPKSAFPTNQVYGPTPNPQLRLITCSGTFDSAQRSYVDNTVVYADVT